MNNDIYDYLNYYKDYTFKDIKFNIIDALLYSIISYVPIDNIREGITLKILNNYMENIKVNGTMVTTAKKIIEIMSKSKRYDHVKLYNLVKKYDDNIEFGALTFRDYDYTFVGFQGSIGTISGWKENLYLTINYPSLTQDEAIKYLKHTYRLKDRNLYIGGHSKGGNLALASFMLSPSYITRKVVKVYNFDGPGFRVEEVTSDRYKELKDRMVNILPDGSMIGVILNHGNYNFIKSKGVSIEKHFPNNWNIFGEFFVEAEENKSSKALHDRIKLGLSKLNDEEKKICLDTVFEVIKNKKVKSVKDFTSLKIDDIKIIVASMKNLPGDKKKILLDTFKAFIKNN